jgi:hypothetical protein
MKELHIEWANTVPIIHERLKTLAQAINPHATQKKSNITTHPKLSGNM